MRGFDHWGEKERHLGFGEREARLERGGRASVADSEEDAAIALAGAPPLRRSHSPNLSCVIH